MAVLSQLQQLAQGVADSETAEGKVEALTQAFELFSRETARLEGAYKALKKKFATVDIELERSNRALNDKVAELDIITTYLHSILNNMSQGILFVALTGDVTTFNQAAERMLETSGDCVLLSQYWDHFADDFFNFSMREALAMGQAPETAFVTLGLRELEVSTTFVLQGEESMQGLILLLRDITEIRRLQVIASRNDRMKELGEMAASVAHEIRNPLGGIKGFASLLCRDLEGRPELQQMAQYIVEGATTLDRLVTDVLNYSRPVQMQLEITDINHQLRMICDFVRADGNLGEGIVLDVITSSTPLKVPLDLQMFKSAILNLLVNGAQAMPGGGTITMAVQEGEGKVCVTVSDSGEGIPSENLEKIFSPFFTTKSEGNGFGLSEVHKIIQAHGGTIDVASKQGQGTIFTIKIPLKA